MVARQYEKDVQAILEKEKIDLSYLEDFAKRLKKLRNKALVHMDGDSIEALRNRWRDAAINPKEIAGCLNNVFKVCQELHALEAQPKTPWPRLVQYSNNPN